MSLTAALNAAVSGLRVNQANVQLVSANVAHATDPNYSRKTLQRETIILDSDQAGGVAVSGYQAAVSQALRVQLESLSSLDGMTSIQGELMGRIQTLFGADSDNAALPRLMADFTAAWQMFQAQPESAAAQRQVVMLGDQFATELRRLSAGLDQIDNEIRGEIETSVARANDLLAKIFEVNIRLKTVDENGAERPDLIDRRDQLVRELATLIDLRAFERDNGSISLITPSGFTLLDGAPIRLAFDGQSVINVADGQSIAPNLRGGRIKALLDFRSDNSAAGLPASSDPTTEVLRKLRAQLDLVASAFTNTVGEPTTFAAAYDSASSSLRISSSLLTTITAGTTTAQYTTLFLQGSVKTGDVFEITINGKTLRYTATARDTNLDQIALQLANLVNADSTLGVSAVNGIASLQLIGSANNVQFSASTSVNGQLPELKQGFFEGADRYSFAINRELLRGTQQLKRNAAVPVVEAMTSAERDFQAGGVFLTDVSYKGLMSGIVGIAATNAKSISDVAKVNHDSLQMTDQRYRSEVGVNLDEELANLQLLQNAYAASARLLTVIQTLFDALQAAVTR